MIAGLDSSTPPNATQVAQAKAAGISMWSGYLITRTGVNIYRPWTQAEFNVVKNLPAMPIAFCSGLDDPVACKNAAAAWGVRLCLDVEGGIRSDGTWVQPWLDASGAGLYGNEPVHQGRNAAFHVLAAYPGANETTDWAVGYSKPPGPCGWQWEGTHTEFGDGVDRGTYDDWFGSQQPIRKKKEMLTIVDTPSEGIWMLSGSMYVHVDDPTVLTSIMASGVVAGQITVDEGMHSILVAGSTSAVVAAVSKLQGPNGSGTITGTLNIT